MGSGRVFVLACDASKVAHRAAAWACQNLVLPGDEVHVLVVTTGGAYGASVTPIGARGNRVGRGLEAVARTNAVHEVLHLAGDKVLQEQFTVAAVKAPPGSAGVAKCINAYAKAHGASLIVLGSRHVGEVASSFMSLLGLGSVSSHVVHSAPCPVAVVAVQAVEMRRKAPAQVLLLVEATTTSGALQWVAANALRPGDHLHLLCTSPPTARLLESARGSAPEAEVHVAELGQAAREGGGGGSSSPAQQCQAALEYVQKHGISLAVLERPQEHGLGAALRRAMGRASLPDLLLQQLGCPAIVLPG